MSDPIELISREALEARYGKVWSAEEFAQEFVVTAIIPFAVVVRRKADDGVGSLEFTNQPRLYFNWQPQEQSQ